MACSSDTQGNKKVQKLMQLVLLYFLYNRYSTFCYNGHYKLYNKMGSDLYFQINLFKNTHENKKVQELMQRVKIIIIGISYITKLH